MQMPHILDYMHKSKELQMVMLVLLLGTHIYFTFRLHGIQRKIPEGIRLSFSGQEEGAGDVSAYSSLATALAATIGTGNIIGISAAVATGGPGAIFWCWITGVFGIATCYAESFLSVKYRIRTKEGNYIGGPMYVLEKVLHQKGLAVLFALFTVLASMGIGSSVQSHSICAAIQEQVPVSPHLIGMGFGVLAGFVIVGGGKQIAKVCTWLVPFMSAFYFLGCFYIMAVNHSYLWEAVLVIVKSAFSSRSFLGGMAGTAVTTGIRIGISKGLFTNEAGMGSIPITAASAKTTSPMRQGIVSMTGVFWDTVVMCAITGIALVSSMIRLPSLYQGAAEDRLCFLAFSQIPLGGEMMLSISLVLFAFATIIGWSYYGECGVRYLWGERGIKIYQLVYMMMVYLGAVVSLNLVWNLSELFNILMAVPNLIGVWLLRKEIIGDTLKA